MPNAELFFPAILLAFLPSIIWLAPFRREDVHPAPNRLIVRVFIGGMLVTIPTIALQGMFHCTFLECPDALGSFGRLIAAVSVPIHALSQHARELLFLFIGIALVEE